MLANMMAVMTPVVTRIAVAHNVPGHDDPADAAHQGTHRSSHNGPANGAGNSALDLRAGIGGSGLGRQHHGRCAAEGEKSSHDVLLIQLEMSGVSPANAALESSTTVGRKAFHNSG
jgi:hypothetical protein